MNRNVIPIVICVIVLAGCEEKVKPTVGLFPSAEVPSQESWNSTIRFTDSARVKAILWAGYIARYTNDRYTILKDSVRVDFFDDAQVHTSLLVAGRGKVDDQSQDFAAYRNVVVTSDGGTVLKTDSLFWNNTTRKIHTTAYVEIISATEEIRGHGMESDQGLKNYKVFKVTGKAVTNE